MGDVKSGTHYNCSGRVPQGRVKGGTRTLTFLAGTVGRREGWYTNSNFSGRDSVGER